MASPNFSSGTGAGEKLSAGDRVGGGRFLLKRLLGRGEISEVWLAQDIKNSRPVALKFLPAALLSDANLVERLKQDAQRHRLLAHLNIAATYEFVRDHSTAFIAMEFVEGWSLAALKVNQLCGCYRVEEIGRWIRELCAALDFAHGEFGIVHSDLKPANLLLTAQNNLKVTDFALAQSVRAESLRRGLAKGVYSGLGFLSPQQVMGAEPSKLDDIYSLGATIYDLLTGTPPFYKGEIFAQICSLKPPSMTERIRELEIQDEPVSPVWEDVVARCLAKNPADRPQSVKEVLQLLERSELPKPAEPQTEIKPVSAVAPVSEEAETTAENPFVVEMSPVGGPGAAPKKNKFVVMALAGILALAAAILIFPKLKSANGSASKAVQGQSRFLDASFNPGTGANDEVRSVAVQPDGKILLGGKFNSFNDRPIKKIIRLNADGSVDESFTPPSPPGTVHAIALQPDGKILVGGETMQAGHVRRRVIRLNADGTLEGHFGAGVNYDKEVRAIVVQPDGKVLVAGNFTHVAKENQNRITRLNPDGTGDDSFHIGNGATGIVSALALQPDGKILAAGKITGFDGHAVSGLVRLLPNGSLDETFKCTGGNVAEVFAVKVLEDGKILVGGNFTSFNGAALTRIARLNYDGTVDGTFIRDSGLDGGVIGFDVQADGKIIIGGDFTHVQGIACGHIARLEAAGSLDKSFNPGTGADNAVWRVALQPDGNFLIVGAFENFDGVHCGGVARLKK